MSPVGRGIVQRMSEVATEMWQTVASSYVTGADGLELHEEDEELDLLHDRLTDEINKGEMPIAVASQLTLISRFYERLGDHAVNLSRRIAALQGLGGPPGYAPSEPAEAGYVTCRRRALTCLCRTAESRSVPPRRHEGAWQGHR